MSRLYKEVHESRRALPLIQPPPTTSTPGLAIREAISHDSAMQPQVEMASKHGAPTPQGSAATVTLHIPGSLREFSGAEAQIALAAASVRELLSVIARERPALYTGICDETGRVRKHMNIFVNNKHIRDREGLETPLAPGDAVYAWPAVSGG